MEREGAWPGEEDVERENWRRRGLRVRDGVKGQETPFYSHLMHISHYASPVG